MAAGSENLKEVSDPMFFLRRLVIESLRELPGWDESKTKTCSMKLNKKLANGDLIMPAFVRRCFGFGVNETKDELQEHCQQIIERLLSHRLVSRCVITDTGHLMLNLQRPHVMSAVICNVINTGDQYGRFRGTNSLSVVLNPVYMLGSQDVCLKLDQLRTIIVSDHCRELLEARGFTVKPVPVVDFISHDCQSDPTKASHETGQEMVELFSLPQTEDPISLRTAVLKKVEELTNVFRNCKYTKQPQQSAESHDSGNSLNSTDALETECNEQTCSQNCDSKKTCGIAVGSGDAVFDVEHFFDDNKQFAGFGKKKSKVSLSSSLVQDVAKLELVGEKADEGSVILHVMSCRRAYAQEQISTVWKGISANPLARKQYYLSHGLVTVHKNGERTEECLVVTDLLRIREEQLRQSYVLKYGDTVQGPRWMTSIRNMAVASIKLEMLSVAANNEIKINLCETSREFRQATFVMYNCARLAKLFQNFEDSVQKGLYPALPPATEVDFSLLRDESEWELVLHFIMAFPSLVEEAVPSTTAETQNLSIQTNKISCFLFNLSHKLSSYYGRVHILGESRQHLFPTMFARLYLMKSLQQILLNCLKLLNVKSLTQM